jgi:uncharacterized paraquat-inducible protein A
MLQPNSNHTPLARPSAPPPVQLLCQCPGCRAHVQRLEELNRQISAECDRLRRELAERERAA